MTLPSPSSASPSSGFSFYPHPSLPFSTPEHNSLIHVFSNHNSAFSFSSSSSSSFLSCPSLARPLPENTRISEAVHIYDIFSLVEGGWLRSSLSARLPRISALPMSGRGCVIPTRQTTRQSSMARRAAKSDESIPVVAADELGHTIEKITDQEMIMMIDTDADATDSSEALDEKYLQAFHKSDQQESTQMMGNPQQQQDKQEALLNSMLMLQKAVSLYKKKTSKRYIPEQEQDQELDHEQEQQSMLRFMSVRPSEDAAQQLHRSQSQQKIQPLWEYAPAEVLSENVNEQQDQLQQTTKVLLENVEKKQDHLHQKIEAAWENVQKNAEALSENVNEQLQQTLDVLSGNVEEQQDQLQQKAETAWKIVQETTEVLSKRIDDQQEQLQQMAQVLLESSEEKLNQLQQNAEVFSEHIDEQQGELQQSVDAAWENFEQHQDQLQETVKSLWENPQEIVEAVVENIVQQTEKIPLENGEQTQQQSEQKVEASWENVKVQHEQLQQTTEVLLENVEEQREQLQQTAESLWEKSQQQQQQEKKEELPLENVDQLQRVVESAQWPRQQPSEEAVIKSMMLLQYAVAYYEQRTSRKYVMDNNQRTLQPTRNFSKNSDAVSGKFDSDDETAVEKTSSSIENPKDGLVSSRSEIDVNRATPTTFDYVNEDKVPLLVNTSNKVKPSRSPEKHEWTDKSPEMIQQQNQQQQQNEDAVLKSMSLLQSAVQLYKEKTTKRYVNPSMLQPKSDSGVSSTLSVKIDADSLSTINFMDSKETHESTIESSKQIQQQQLQLQLQQQQIEQLQKLQKQHPKNRSGSPINPVDLGKIVMAFLVVRLAKLSNNSSQAFIQNFQDWFYAPSQSINKSVTGSFPSFWESMLSMFSGAATKADKKSLSIWDRVKQTWTCLGPFKFAVTLAVLLILYVLSKLMRNTKAKYRIFTKMYRDGGIADGILPGKDDKKVLDSISKLQEAVRLYESKLLEGKTATPKKRGFWNRR